MLLWTSLYSPKRGSHDTPLHRQLHQQVAEAIRTGRLPSGARLPSTHVLAALLLAAYDDRGPAG
ncbi:MAG: hypothetical protein ABI811_17350 [Acidobacteriota bacterium]